MDERSVRDLLGIEADPVGPPVIERLHPDDRGTEEAAVAALLAGDIERYDHEQRWIGTDGEAVWVRSRVSLATDPHGQPLRMGQGRAPCVIRQLLDVTDRPSRGSGCPSSSCRRSDPEAGRAS